MSAVKMDIKKAEIIIRVACEHFSIQPAKMTGKGREQPLARVRQIAMSAVRDLTMLSLSDVGLVFGGRGHDTVIHACKAQKSISVSDPDLFEMGQRFREKAKMEILEAFSEVDPYEVRIGGVKADPYVILKAYEITHPAIQQAIKKLLRAGRKHKNPRQDVADAITSLKRWEEMEA